eukprot:TRINITY_DN67314_c5_g1_i19.p1 TRINITY_DN67314_c5_g1~~TRINITY_DN67314_c5_g1_i19.p1  ORF type:complete len:326 (+),score=32.78 TRINITY_DN67314_c5_g1_i19:73-978(+)
MTEPPTKTQKREVDKELDVVDTDPHSDETGKGDDTEQEALCDESRKYNNTLWFDGAPQELTLVNEIASKALRVKTTWAMDSEGEELDRTCTASGGVVKQGDALFVCTSDHVVNKDGLYLQSCFVSPLCGTEKPRRVKFDGHERPGGKSTTELTSNCWVYDLATSDKIANMQTKKILADLTADVSVRQPMPADRICIVARRDQALRADQIGRDQPLTTEQEEQLYGPCNMLCVYSGKVLTVEARGTKGCWFTHDINTYASCSGSFIFFLSTTDGNTECLGKAVGVHCGGNGGMKRNVGVQFV